jgi:hypothetical protein
VTDQEKAAEVLDTPATAHESTNTQIVEAHDLDRKEFDTLRARFAICGYSLQIEKRVSDGRRTFHVTRPATSHVFSHSHDLAGFLAVVEGARR